MPPTSAGSYLAAPASTVANPGDCSPPRSPSEGNERNVRNDHKERERSGCLKARQRTASIVNGAIQLRGLADAYDERLHIEGEQLRPPVQRPGETRSSNLLHDVLPRSLSAKLSANQPAQWQTLATLHTLQTPYSSAFPSRSSALTQKRSLVQIQYRPPMQIGL